jgi:uncharacterized tellurite resistance protein B-like protein
LVEHIAGQTPNVLTCQPVGAPFSGFSSGADPTVIDFNTLTKSPMTFNDLITLFRQGKATGKSHIKNLIEMAAADNNLDNMEFDLLKEIGKRNGISERQITEIRKKPDAVAFIVPQDPREKFSQLFDLVRMMSVDKSVHQEERRLCNVFAVKFGYKRESAEELVTAIHANISNGSNLDETLKRCSIMIA